MSATITVVPMAVKALTNEQLLAVYNRWSTKPCKKFEKRSCGEQRVAKLLEDLEMSIEDACSAPSDDGYAGEGWDAAFPAKQAEDDGPIDPDHEDPAYWEHNERMAEIAASVPNEATSPAGWSAPEAPDVVEVVEPEPVVAEATDEAEAPVEKPKRKRGELGTTAQAIFGLASRETGASAKELMAATGWKAGPSWPNQFNRLSLRTGTRFHQQKVAGEMRYYLS